MTKRPEEQVERIGSEQFPTTLVDTGCSIGYFKKLLDKAFAELKDSRTGDGRKLFLDAAIQDYKDCIEVLKEHQAKEKT